jgi:hypothetical protein
MGAKRIRDIYYAEDHVGQQFEQGDNRLRARSRRRQGKAKQNRDKHNLQNVTFGEGVRHCGRDDVHQEFGYALRLGLSGIIGDRFGIEGGRIYIEAAAGTNHVAHDKPNRQRYG